MVRFRFRLLVLIVLTIFFTACKKEPTTQIIHIERGDWAEDVRQGINDFMETYAHSDNAYVVFDFDNTVSIFDIEVQLMVYQLQTMAFEISPEQLRSVLLIGVEDYETQLSDWINDAVNAYTYLVEHYTDGNGFHAAGLNESQQAQIQSDPMWMEFATKMAKMYEKVDEYASTDASYLWILNWFSGMTWQEVYDLSTRSHRKYAAVPTSKVTWNGPTTVTSLVGPVDYTWTSGIQVSENIKELWKALKTNGIDIWVCSSSGMPQVLAAIDVFDLDNYCTGVMAMTMKLDENGRYLPEYDYNGTAYLHYATGWTKDNIPIGSLTAGLGKVCAIDNVIRPRKGNQGPLAGFMDSSGDFNFCTEYSSLKMVVCFNRANREVTDGGGLVAEVAIYERDYLHWDIATANAKGETMYLLQGRDENGMRGFLASNATLRYGSTSEQLFANENNQTQLNYFIENEMAVTDIFNTFSIYTASSILGFPYGFLSSYNGYHSR